MSGADPSMRGAIDGLIAACRDVLARTGARAEVSLYSQFETFFRKAFDTVRPWDAGVKLRVFQQMNAEKLGVPDYRVERGNELLGWIEIKGVVEKNLTRLTGHDRDQLERFRNGLTNLVLTNGWQWRLYQHGQQIGQDVVLGPQDLFDPTHLESAPSAEAARELETLLTNFLSASSEPYTSAPTAVAALAARAKALKLALVAAGREGSAKNLVELESDFRALLFRNGVRFDWERFVDSYVQLATFGALLWRLETDAEISLDKQVGVSGELHPLLAQCLAILWSPDSRVPIIAPLLEELCGTINNIPPALFQVGLPSGPGRRRYVPDPIVHAYEPFFEVYDPATRETKGVYYTPVEIVEYIVGGIGHLLQSGLGRSEGLLDEEARFLDPATGTGTFLLGLANAVAGEASDAGLPVDQVVEEVLVNRTSAFEIFPGPYTIAHQRLEVALRALGASPASRLPIYLADTLAAPTIGRLRSSGFGIAGSQIQLERREADRLKTAEEILVIFGNPPYERVLQSDEDGFEPFAQQLFDQLRAATPAGSRADLKSTKDLFIAFWLWALWALQSPANRRSQMQNPQIEPRDCHGIVAYISNRTWIVGRSLTGLRALVRKGAKEVWICDLGGDGRGAHGARSFAGGDANVFGIRTGVAIAWVVFDREHEGETSVWYRRIYGTRGAKLEHLHGTFRPEDFEEVEATSGGSFLPDRWDHPAMRTAPSLDTLFIDEPETGLQTARDTRAFPPLGTSKEEVFAVVSHERHKRTVGSLAEWSRLRSRQRYDEWVTAQKRRTNEDPPDPGKLTDQALRRYVFRPLDFRWLYDDPKWIDWYRPYLHAIYQGDRSVPSLVTIPQDHGAGPAVIHVDRLMDQHSYNNRGAKGVFSLWHPDNTSMFIDQRTPIVNGFRCGFAAPVYDWLESLDLSGRVEEAYDYILAVLSAPGYTAANWQALERDFLRVPLTDDRSVFSTGAKLGDRLREAWTLNAPRDKSLTWLGRSSDPLGSAKFVGDGVVFANGRKLAGVSAEAWSFEVSNYLVLRNWLRAREHWHLTPAQAREAIAVGSSLSAMITIGGELDRFLSRVLATAPSD